MSVTSFVLPELLQGGMGVGVSSWRLASAVALCGQLGVVSGTGLDTLFVRRLQDGDPDGSLRRAMARFPWPELCAQVLEKYFRPEGRPVGKPYRALAKFQQTVSWFRQQVTVLANFVEVHLAKEGHEGPIGINLLTKIQAPNLASLYGAMLARVDVVLMGAGIPREIPRALDELAEHRPTSLRLELEDAEAEHGEEIRFDPRPLGAAAGGPLARPRFLPIVASNSLATLLARKAEGRVDGLVVEAATAGGHNAPPRGERRLNDRGEPIYGERDRVDLERLGELGLPFWLAGGQGSPERLEAARAAGARGVQVGTLFAYCRESGFAEPLKRRVVEALASHELDVRTDASASPTGFPFKVVQLEGTLSDPALYAARRRVCDLGYLATAYRRPDGAIGYRCAAEPVEDFVAKGGDAGRTDGRKCLCNALLAAAGHSQVRPGAGVEPPIVTSGDDLEAIRRMAAGRGVGQALYSAADVVGYLLRRDAAPA
jgi:NAD(P)H-dependent flavin oxidoreductase YrpB (nitropropane dioxygenase family)